MMQAGPCKPLGDTNKYPVAEHLGTSVLQCTRAEEKGNSRPPGLLAGAAALP